MTRARFTIPLPAGSLPVRQAGATVLLAPRL